MRPIAAQGDLVPAAFLKYAWDRRASRLVGEAGASEWGRIGLPKRENT